MKTFIKTDLFLINLLSLLLILFITLCATSPARVVLGVPFLLFLPGYALVSAMFPRRSSLERVELVALSFGLSISVVAVIGLILNLTPHGLSLYTILASTAIFIFIASVIAWYQRRRFNETEEFIIPFKIKMLRLGSESVVNRVLYVLLIVTIIGTLWSFSRLWTVPKVVDSFTELYVLGSQGKTESYPTQFILKGDKVVRVRYGDSESVAENDSVGKVLLSIANYERKEVTYYLEVVVDKEPVEVWVNGIAEQQIGPIKLSHGEKWEQEIGFAPRHVGNAQRVDFVLYRDGKPYFDEPPHLWVDAIEE